MQLLCKMLVAGEAEAAVAHQREAMVTLVPCPAQRPTVAQTQRPQQQRKGPQRSQQS